MADQADYYQRNKERLKAAARARYYANREAILVQKKAVYDPEQKRKYNQKYYLENKDDFQKYYDEHRYGLKSKSKQYYWDHRDDRLNAVKLHYNENKEEIKRRAALRMERLQKEEPEKFLDQKSRRKIARQGWENNNREHIREYQNNYKRVRDKERRLSEPSFCIEQRLRARIRAALRVSGGAKSKRTMELVGCSIEQLIEHLSNQFRDGMSWENRHLWHIDHIRPCSSFDLTDPEQQRQCFHFSNLQPLWAQDNIKKRNKVII